MRIVILAFIAAFHIACPASFAADGKKLTPLCNQTPYDLCGYIDADIRKNEGRTVFVVEPEMEIAREFSEGLSAFRLDGKFGFIDHSGAVVIEPTFEQVGQFENGLALASEGSLIGVINRAGDYVVTPMFSGATIFSEEIIIANATNISDRPARIPYSPLSRISFLGYDVRDAGLFHIRDGWLTEQKYRFKHFDKDGKDLVWAQAPAGEKGIYDDLYGLMRLNGEWLIPPRYDSASILEHDRAIARKTVDGNSVSGAIDGRGDEVIPFKFDWLNHFDAEYLLAGKGEYDVRKFGLLSRKGELLGGRYFDEVLRPNGLFNDRHPKQDFYSVKDGDVWISLLKDGTLLPDQRIGLVFVECDRFQILYAENGYVLKPRDTSLPTVPFDEPRFPYTNSTCTPPPNLIRGKTSAAILEDGTVFGGFFEISGSFFGTHRWVMVNGQWGLVDVDGTFAIPPVYDAIVNEGGFQARKEMPVKETDTTYKVSIFSRDYRLRFVDGAYIQEPYTEPVIDRSMYLDCKGGFKRQSKDGLWGIVDKNGDYVIPPRYRAITCFQDGMVLVPNDEKRQWCWVDRYGSAQTASACRDSYYPIYRSHHDPEKFHEDPYESNVLWIRAWLEYRAGRREAEPQFVPW